MNPSRSVKCTPGLSARPSSPGNPGTSTAWRANSRCICSATNDSWPRMSDASVKQKRSSPCRANSSVVQPNTRMSSRMAPPTRGMVGSSSRPGAQRPTEGNGPGCVRPSARQRSSRPARSSLAAYVLLGRSRCSRSSPLTLKMSTRARFRMSGCSSSRRVRASAVLVLVATPLMPEMEMCPPLVPSTKSRSRFTGAPSRARPMARRRVMVSSYSARDRSTPRARRTGSPGCGATHRSGSTRTTCTSAVRETSPGIWPAAITCVSDGRVAPSSCACASVTTP